MLKMTNCHISSGFIDRHDIWHNDTQTLLAIKIFNVLKSKMADNCHFEKPKIAISWQQFDQSPQNLVW